MSNLPPIKISHELIMASGIMLVGLIALAVLIMTISLQGSTQNAIVYLYNLINQSQNNSFQLETNGHLAYLQQSILGVSQSCNLTSQDSLRRINNLTESDKNLLNRIVADEGRIENLTTYIGSLNMTCTNTTTTVYVNQTVPVQAVPADNRSCRQKVMDEHGLGPLFDVFACCNNVPPVGYWQECCACYK